MFLLKKDETGTKLSNEFLIQDCPLGNTPVKQAFTNSETLLNSAYSARISISSYRIEQEPASDGKFWKGFNEEMDCHVSWYFLFFFYKFE